ncbi:MAG: DUF2784 domain-containing protein [Pirellulaceae bacterium]|nr:DUF2784 domain-containing protein [Planctomycetales bacterium]MCA9209761.1 DUF2784 domain-containing protein [Planctomycetales bacterium]MCA9218712.1 DUF2784 domain-containing protein [Planctomycetales bacterium]
MNIYRLLADAVVTLHIAYVLFVILGLLVVLIGRLLHWTWIRNPWFRFVHLAMIGIVVVESWLKITCPLTTLEDWLRLQAGETVTDGSFIGRWMHDLLFLEAEPWVFTMAYTLFGAAVLLTLFWAPPRLAKQQH